MSSDTVELPSTVDELAALLRTSETRNEKVGISGAGTKATWGGVRQPADVVIDTTGLTGVIEHAPGDLVVSVRAGTRLADLQDELSRHRQWLALDPPEDGATIGGILATAASGPHRLRFGTPRDQLIGITVALADGTVAKSGGKVVKNVAGYDLGKLFTGSFGTLGVIVSATFKLQPLPPARRFVTVPAGEPGPVAVALAQSTATASAAEWDGHDVTVVVEAAASAVDTIADSLARALGTSAIADRPPAGFGTRPWIAGQVAIKLTHRLSALDELVAGVRGLLPDATMSAHVGSGVVWCGWTPAAGSEVADVVERLRSAASSYDGTVVIVDAPDEVKRSVEVWGPARGVSLMHRIKDQFDPGHRLNAGRFVDGI